MILRQMQVGQMMVFAYLLGDQETGEALVIDPAADVEGIIAVAAENKLKIKYIVNTHSHLDHTAGNAEMKRLTGAQIIVHEAAADQLINTPDVYLSMFKAKPSPPADIKVKDGDQIRVGSIALTVLYTPGHTEGGMCLYMDGFVFTGDTLFVEAVGRTDFPGGSWDVMYRSIKEKLFTLPEETAVLPGHNYGPSPTSTIGHEKRHNPFVR
ncbi:MAG: MBL fold metallo-hydrolase [Syntrophales bacterium]